MKHTSYKLTALLWEIKWRGRFLRCFHGGHGKTTVSGQPTETRKRFIFSLWKIPMEEISIFVNFAHLFHRSTLRSILLVKCHLNALFSLDTDVFKGPRLSTLRILDSQTHFKPTETFQYTHFSSCQLFNTKKRFTKGEALRLLRTNSVKEIFFKYKRDFEQLSHCGRP